MNTHPVNPYVKNKGLLFYFSIVLIILMGLDVFTTYIALQSGASEMNPLMKPVVTNIYLFIFIKLVGSIIVIYIFSKVIKMKEGKKYCILGMRLIIVMMLFVVGSNSIQIASAVSYGFPSPYQLEFPGRVEQDFSQSYAFIGHNNYNVTEYFSFNSTANGGLEYVAANRFYSDNMVRFAVLDWVHPYRMFLVFSNLDVAYTDSVGVDYANGYYADNVWPLTGCSNCNDLHKIGVLTKINNKMNGFVDSNGNLNIAEGNTIVQFVRSADYSKTTLFTATGYAVSGAELGCGSSGDDILDMALNSDGTKIHLVLGGYTITNSGCGTVLRTHTYKLNYLLASYPSGNLISTEVIRTTSEGLNGYPQSRIESRGDILAGNSTANYVISYPDSYAGTTIYLKYYNGSAYTDICPTSCGTITGLNGLQIYGGYAYLASAAENKIYRFPTTIQASSGSGFVPGIGTGATEAAEITYRTSTVSSLYSTYYNNSQVVVRAVLDMDSGYNILGDNYLVNLDDYRWEIDVIDPLGVVYNQKATGACVDAWEPLNPLGRCTLTVVNKYNAPATGWISGNWTAKLYETANGGHRSLLATSSAWVIYNSSSGSSGSVVSPIGSPPSGEGWGVPSDNNSKSHTVSMIDGQVQLLGYGVNNFSRLLYSVIWILIFVVVALILTKDGMIGITCGFLPFAFFSVISFDADVRAAGIEFIPKWVSVMFVILIALSFRILR